MALISMVRGDLAAEGVLHEILQFKYIIYPIVFVCILVHDYVS